MSHAPTTTLEHRHRRVRDELRGRNLDALVVFSRPNITYVTNFTGSSAIVVVAMDRVWIITDFRYVTACRAAQEGEHACPGLELVVVSGSYEAALVDLIGRLGARAVGFEAAHVAVSRHDWLRRTLRQAGHSLDLVGVEHAIERARLCKDAYEVATLREAARRLSGVASQVAEEIAPGRSERDIALGIDVRIRRAGFERSAFETIVASGPLAALPHARAGDRTLTEGDLVVLDFGGVYDSYCVDLTRTVSVGRASQQARDVYGAVLEAHDRAIAAVAPGQSRFAIDQAARDLLTARGLGEAFGHGTGHGLGLEVHEGPRITRRISDQESDDEAVEPGMVFTIEPGAYLPGWGGVRIEDDVLVTATGVEVLTNVTTELLEL